VKYRLAAAFLAALMLPACSSIEVGEDELFQDKPTITPADFSKEGVTLDERFIEGADGTRLNAWHVTQPGAKGTVLYFGGNGFFLVHAKGYVEAMTDYPVNLFLIDYRGYGKSAGEPSVQAIRRDAPAVFDYVVDSLAETRPRATVVHGHSMGTFMAARVGRKRETAGVILQNPATTAEEWTDALTPWYLEVFLRLEPSAPLTTVNNVKQVRALDEPLLIVSGAQDNITDPAMARRLHEAAPAGQTQLAVIDSAGHNIPHDDAAYERVVSGFLENVLPGESAEGAKKGTMQKGDAVR
jgi:pimeloyl-ACP methyl ester carboxylesterase